MVRHCRNRGCCYHDVCPLLRRVAACYARTRLTLHCTRTARLHWCAAVQVSWLASGLAAAGLAAGDRVGVFGANSPEWMMAQLVREGGG